MRGLVCAASASLVTSLVVACGSSGHGSATPPGEGDGSSEAVPPDAGGALDSRAPFDAGLADGSAPDGACTVNDGAVDGSAASLCYALTCNSGGLHTLQQNRDRLIADYATRRCSDSCTLWAALNEAERYIFLMDTAYFGSPSSRLYPPSYGNAETALDHALALYTINGPKAGQGVLLNGLGGNDYNRIYLGFDLLASCVMRNFTVANPAHVAGYNQWVKSDDLGGPHAPFTQRDMIAWFRAFYDLQTQGPQFHFWHEDSDFTQSGLNQRLGVCGVTDPTITESTIAFNSVHDSDPLGSYSSDGASMGGFGWQIVDQFVGIIADWTYMPSGCPTTPPVNTSTTGGGTFAGMGSSLDGSVCWPPEPLGDGGACAASEGGLDAGAD
jgi:hypothetical protein